MSDKMIHEHGRDGQDNDGIERRGFLKCMAWAGTGLLWTMSGGALTSCALRPGSNEAVKGVFSFVQISDSHIGFNKAPNQDVTATLQETISRINALPEQPAFLIHTGDLSHLSKPEEFDTIAQVLKSSKANQVYYVPGEHDVFVDEGKQYLERYGKGTQGKGWHSYDYKGVHFIGLNNVMGAGTGAGGGVVAGGEMKVSDSSVRSNWTG